MDATETKRANGPRTKKRSRSGAHSPCPRCGKQIRGEKGLRAHVVSEHGEAK